MSSINWKEEPTLLFEKGRGRRPLFLMGGWEGGGGGGGCYGPAVIGAMRCCGDPVKIGELT